MYHLQYNVGFYWHRFMTFCNKGCRGTTVQFPSVDLIEIKMALIILLIIVVIIILHSVVCD